MVAGAVGASPAVWRGVALLLLSDCLRLTQPGTVSRPRLHGCARLRFQRPFTGWQRGCQIDCQVEWLVGWQRLRAEDAEPLPSPRKAVCR